MKLLSLSFFLLLSSFGISQPGSLDKSFNKEDPGFGIGDKSSFSLAYKVGNQPFVYLGVNFIDGFDNRGIAKIDILNGNIDTTNFHIDDSIQIARILAVQEDYKIIALLQFWNDSTIYLKRLMSNGSIDHSFLDSVIVEGDVYVVKIQKDGKVLLGGQRLSINHKKPHILARLEKDGTIDKSFHIGTFDFLSISGIRDIEIQQDRKIWICGNFFNYDSTGRKLLVRLNSNGTVDSTCAITNTAIQQIALQPDGKLVGVGRFDQLNNKPLKKYGLIRFNIDGSLDSLFPAENLLTPIGDFYDIKILKDERILLCGDFYLNEKTLGPKYSTRVVCYDSFGKLDSTFQPGNGIDQDVQGIIQLDDGDIILGGNFTLYHRIGRNGIVKVNIKGEVDSVFYRGYGFNSYGPYCWINKITPDHNDHYYVGGVFTRYNGASRNAFTRILNDGSVDYNFDIGTGFSSSWVDDIIVQPDQKVLVFGGFQYYKNDSLPRLIRLLPDGHLDTTFKLKTPFTGDPFRVRLGKNNNIWVFEINDTSGLNCLVKLNENGSLDTNIKVCWSSQNGINSMEVQPDGKLVITGVFTEVNGYPAFNVARLNEDGSIDPSFKTGSGFDSGARKLIIQPDQKIVFADLIKTYNGHPCAQIIRLLPDGSVDSTFNLDVRLNNSNSRFFINMDMLMLSDGSYLLSGDFTYLNDGTTRKIIKLNKDGSLDNEFVPPITNGRTSISSLAEEKDGKIIFAGDFVECNGIGVNRIGRLNNTLSTVVHEANKSDEIIIYPNPSKDHYYIETNNSKAQYYSISDLSGKQLFKSKIKIEKTEVNLSNFEEGTYLINIYTSSGIVSKQVIKVK